MNYIIYASKLRFGIYRLRSVTWSNHGGTFLFYLFNGPIMDFATLYRLSRHLHTCHRAQFPAQFPAKLNTWPRFFDLSNVLLDFPYHVFVLGQSNSQIRTISFYFLGIFAISWEREIDTFLLLDEIRRFIYLFILLILLELNSILSLRTWKGRKKTSSYFLMNYG